MNLSDSERFASILAEIGFEPCKTFSEADLIIINTCSVKQKAEDRINGYIKFVRSQVGSSPVIVISGCIARRIWDENRNVSKTLQKKIDDREKELLKQFPLANFIVETKYFYKIRERLAKAFNEPKYVLSSDQKDYLSYKPIYNSKISAFVPISTGCNHFCTFCIVPFSRGKEVCRSAEEIITEVSNLIKTGYKEITLLGQTVNRWINPKFSNLYEYNEAQTSIKGLNGQLVSKKEVNKWRTQFEKFLKNNTPLDFTSVFMPRDFLQLLQVLDQLPGEWWLNWVSSHPNYFTSKLISYIGKSIEKNNDKALYRTHQKSYLHLALQSGSDDILKKMNRRHNFKQFYEKINKIRKYCPEISLSTDIIVGFIGETEKDFKMTIDAEKKCKFEMIYISEYSPRKGTAAARLQDNISLETKSSRKVELNNVLRSIAIRQNRKLINSCQRVLLESYNSKSQSYMGRTHQNKAIQISTTKNLKPLIGQFIDVKVTSVTAWSLSGNIK